MKKRLLRRRTLLKKDITWSSYFEDEERFADFVNCFGCNGVQYVQEKDVHTEDAKGYFMVRKDAFSKMRDVVRRVAFGVNFCIIGIENQEVIDYAYPLRELTYTVANYEKQRRKIARKVKKLPKALLQGSEYLYRFRKTDRLKPTITFLLYSGLEEWDGSTDLQGMLDLTQLPADLKDKVQNYRVNLIEIRKLSEEQISELKTDLKQVLQFIKCSQDKTAIRALLKNDRSYQKVEKDAYLVMSQYTHSEQLLQEAEVQEEGGYINMCKAIDDIYEDGVLEGQMRGRAQGREEGRNELIKKMLGKGKSVEEIADICDLEYEKVQQVQEKYLMKL